MCNFKHCKGPHACFLRDISPCPEACVSASDADVPQRPQRVRSKGFIDQDALIAALGIDNELSEVAANDNVVRVTSKILRAAETLGHHKAS